ncbi:cytochrome P450 [Phenylobacterium sp.]|uniref:cytochrome P450 n=1 Tax=Phenylobacterium sp. TaxID=1871053 RepID=UPI001201D9C0|nr:cytochrome P450 [Phenylobacterium sp.]THD57499.1 MAG: cytochrome P450 [Phenylobacterium sp.]
MAAFPPTLDIDPFSDQFLADPYPDHERLRAAGPVVWLEKYGVYASARHAEVQQALQDWRTFSSAAGVGLANIQKGEAFFRPPSLVLEADPPLHERTRPVLALALSPSALRDLRPKFEAEAHALLDRLVSHRAFDGVTELAEVYPIRVFADALGLCEEGREHLLPYAAFLFNAFGPRNQRFEETLRAGEEARDWVTRQCNRGALRPGSLGARVFDGVDRGEVSVDEAALLVRSLLSAGLDTTVYGLGNALFAMATHPEAWAQLQARPELARPAFEEALRFESSVQTFFRTTTTETELGGVALPAGAKILLFLGAANRDSRRWEQPDRFDILRKTSGHVAFGYGIHSCVGQAVARMEGEIVLQALAERIERIELAAPPVRRLNNTLRGLASLALRVTPRRG